MSITTVKHQLRALPYTEMKALAKQLSDELGGMIEEIGEGDWPPIIAEALATLPLTDDKQLENEDVFLSRALAKKRGGRTNIHLKPVMTGRDISAWEATAGDFSATELTVRGAVSALLDQVASYEALVGTGK